MIITWTTKTIDQKKKKKKKKRKKKRKTWHLEMVDDWCYVFHPDLPVFTSYFDLALALSQFFKKQLKGQEGAGRQKVKLKI